MAQKDIYAHRVHVRRCGGNGRISSLTQTLETVLEEEGTRRVSKILLAPMLGGILLAQDGGVAGH